MLDGKCPRCGATGSEPCRSSNGSELAAPHRVRVDYIQPTPEQVESQERAARRRQQWADWDARH